MLGDAPVEFRVALLR